MSETPKNCVVYPGSFDPFTWGHLDILKRALHLFPRVVVLVVEDGKAGLFPVATRVGMIRSAVAELPGVEVKGFGGLLVDTVAELGAAAVIRGIRCAGDYEHEWSLAGVNFLLANDVEFVYFLARPQLAAISSTLVRDVLSHGGSLEKLVPPEIASVLMAADPDS